MADQTRVFDTTLATMDTEAMHWSAAWARAMSPGGPRVLIAPDASLEGHRVVVVAPAHQGIVVAS